jgi:death-on-curing protein
VRYLSTAEALAIAEEVTGLDARTLLRVSRVGLLESALHAPQAGFGDVEFYPDFVDKAAVLVVHIARNHPLPDGNKRLAWVALTMFCALNGRRLAVATDDAVALTLAIASGENNEGDVADWLAERIETSNG